MVAIMNNHPLLTTREVAQLLRVSSALIYAWASNGTLKAIYLPHARESQATKQNRCSIRFRVEDVDEFIKIKNIDLGGVE